MRTEEEIKKQLKKCSNQLNLTNNYELMIVYSNWINALLWVLDERND